ncbi:MAG: hypothetical protein Q7T05_01505, partial [Dehalococcoidia bacterium]|nr:hypothetical protein [Dehalococcoidia bacterium]
WGFFQTVQSGRLRAFDANGNLLWSMGSTAGNPPAIRADGRPVCSNYSEGRLYEYEPVSGAYQQYPRVADFLSTPITDSLGKVFVIGWQKHLEEGQPTDQPDAATANLYCFDICRGERWRLPMPNAGGLLLGRDRRLYVAASNPAALHILRE